MTKKKNIALEELLVYALLLDVGYSTDYDEYLNTLFLEMPDNELLLELQWCSSDTHETIIMIREFCYGCDVNYDVFGRFLFSKLEKIYRQDSIDIKTFGKKSYEIWTQLPEAIDLEEPFGILNYAADPLSWGDEEQTRKLYEKVFRFYDNTPKELNL